MSIFTTIFEANPFTYNTTPFVYNTNYPYNYNVNTIVTSSPLYTTTSVLSTEPMLISPEVIFPNIFDVKKPAIINFDYSHPLLGVYETIDNNVETRDKMVQYVYDLVRDKWLLDDINDVLNYYTYHNGEVKMINKMSDYSENNIDKDTDAIAEKKIKYITKTILDKYALQDIIDKFVKGTNTKWVNLPKNEFFLMKYIKEQLIKKIHKLLK